MAVAGGGRALGRIAIRECGDVLLMCLEDGARRLQKRLRTVLGTDLPPACLSIATEWAATDKCAPHEHPRAVPPGRIALVSLVRRGDRDRPRDT